ncbi:MAG TPA: response regulator, partial [Exilispira sp.]|nr:response regulator [Exilispira sp.]
MNDDKIRVLVVDDSATMRKLLMQILQQDNEIEVVGTAMNGIFALNKLESLKPDIITLDIEMPQMDGLQFLEEKNKKNDTTPVIILSSLTTSGSSTTMRALELGAKDFILKPSGSISMDLADISEEIIAKVKNWAKKGIL